GVQKEARKAFTGLAADMKPPGKIKTRFDRAVKNEQIGELENLWYLAENEKPFAGQLLQLAERLGEKYQVEELAAKYVFTGDKRMSVPEALLIKEELEKIDRLLKQLEEAEETGQIGVVDLDELAEFAEPGDISQLTDLQKQIDQYLKDLAEQQGLERDGKSFRLTPRAHRLFQSKVLEIIFSELAASRTGRHQGPTSDDGAVETARTKEYEFGDSLAHLDVPQAFVNAMIRDPASRPVRLRTEDLAIHRTRNTPKAATCVLLDMSGSMRYGGQYVDVKRMALALEGLIRSEFPGDYLQFIELYSVAKPRHVSEIASLMPKPVTIFDPVVRLKADTADPDVSEAMLPPHFTNIQHGLQLARQFLARRDTPNRQVVLITDGLPTAHFEGSELFFLYPPDPRTERATLREAAACAREGIIINLFLLQNWNQSEEDIHFAHNLAESTGGRVAFAASKDLDRFVVWDYVKRRKAIIG
ncbi:MAG TPA: hypothetical protein VNC50_11095, partial [Planctomycetia bacterium]|nr:hypothetical protein [Planctomycetia bacterium]